MRLLKGRAGARGASKIIGVDINSHPRIHVAYHSLTSNNSRARPKLKILPMQCNQQGSKEECGFYVMQWMETIIRMGIKTSWAQTFQNKESFDDEAIVHTRKQWASFLLECKKHHKIDD